MERVDRQVTAAVAETVSQRSVIIDQEAGATTITIGSHTAASQPIHHVVYYITGVNKTGVPTFELSQIAPGDIVDIFCAAGGSQKPTLTVTAFAFGPTWTEAQKEKVEGKVAKINFYGPDEPTITRVAGCDFVYKSDTIANIMGRLK